MVLRIGIIGAGTAGLAAGAFLARDGHSVTVYERADELSPVGAGLLLQPTGAAVLEALGVLGAVRDLAAEVRGLSGVTERGRVVMSIRYADLEPGLCGLGVHRGALCGVLEGAALSAGVEVMLGRAAESVVDPEQPVVVFADGSRAGPFDVLLVADGARSVVRGTVFDARRVRRYPWGALWFIGELGGGTLDGDVLAQVYRGTREMLGFLPSGRVRAGGPRLVSLFWSVRNADWDGPGRFDFGAWRARALAMCPAGEPVIEQIGGAEDLIFAPYYDVVLRTPVVGRVVAMGDAAHAMSPQLGQGANLALLDALALSRAVTEAASVDGALAAYRRAQAGRWWYYQFASRWLTPFFQSSFDAGGWARDAFGGVSCAVPVLRRQMLLTLVGVKTGVVGTGSETVVPMSG